MTLFVSTTLSKLTSFSQILRSRWKTDTEIANAKSMIWMKILLVADIQMHWVALKCLSVQTRTACLPFAGHIMERWWLVMTHWMILATVDATTTVLQNSKKPGRTSWQTITKSTQTKWELVHNVGVGLPRIPKLSWRWPCRRGQKVGRNHQKFWSRRIIG